MNIPIQSSAAARRVAGAAAPRHTNGVTAACSIGEQIGCCGIALGVTAACATVETGVGIAACIAAIAGYVSSDCEDCVCGEPLKQSVCGWVGIINSIDPGAIPVPSFC